MSLLYGMLQLLGDLATYVVEAIAVGLAAGVVYFVALFLLERLPDRRATLWIILAAALLFRLQLFPLQPTLSDDLHRYRWDGRVQSAAWNPYTVKPDDPRLAPLRDSHWQRTPGRDIASIYPPLAELVYAATHRLLAGFDDRAAVILFKLPFLGADLLVVLLLAGWIRRTGGRNYQLAVYAWNPLVIVEFAASGHNDSLAVLAVAAACLVIIRGRWMLSTSLLTAGALAKAFPAVLLPLVLRRTGWPGRLKGWLAAIAALALGAACAWPYRSAWPGILDSLTYYESRWQQNNAGLYSVLVWFSGSSTLAVGIGIGVVVGLALWAAARQLDLLRAAYLVFGAILLLAPNGYSWYFTWMVPLLVFFPHPAWLLLTVLQFLSYHVLMAYQASGLWQFRAEYLWLTYGPFYGWLLVSFLRDSGHWREDGRRWR